MRESECKKCKRRLLDEISELKKALENERAAHTYSASLLLEERKKREKAEEKLNDFRAAAQALADCLK